MSVETLKKIITQGEAILGIELGSTRIKAVLIAPDYSQIAIGSHHWENKLVDDIWTYDLNDVWAGLQSCFKNLSDEIKNTYDVSLKKVNAIGISAMMHGYLVFDSSDKLLTPFRTWRNTITKQASEELTSLFGSNIPQRWNIAHLYQAILNKEEHIKQIDFTTTLAGYVHWQLTGEKVLGIGDASGVFPIDSNINDYSEIMSKQFDNLLEQKNIHWKLKDILPTILPAGVKAGVLSEKGARLLDPTGVLESGISMCPPEGDAGTGMVATNSVAPHTGNVSAGTSIFAMIVLDKSLNNVYPEIDMVTTPDGKPVAMVHCNNCTSDLDAWMDLFAETIEAVGIKIDKNKLYESILNAAIDGETDGGGLLCYNYYAGEPIVLLEEGRPLLVRLPGAKFSLGNLMRANLYSSVATLKIGMDILFEGENISVEQLLGHGGFFKTTDMGQRVMAAAMGVPVAVMETAGEGGAWGIALLAAYMQNKQKDQTLRSYLADNVFSKTNIKLMSPLSSDVKGFTVFLDRFKQGLALEKLAINKIN